MKKQILLMTFVLGALVLSGCSISVKNQAKQVVEKDLGGIYKSINKGTSWKNMSLINTVTGKPGNFSVLDVNKLIFDPSDSKALYFGGITGGLMYTFDGAESWNWAKGLGQIAINSVAVDPRAKCIIYVSSGNKLFKTTDCARTWKSIYVDNAETVVITSIAIDHYNSDIVYFGLSRGDLVKSANGGIGWKTVHRFYGSVDKMVIDPNDSRVKYIVLNTGEVFRYVHDTGEWDSILDNYREFNVGAPVNELIIIPENPGWLYMSSPTSILRSENYGNNWTKIDLLTPDALSTVNSMAVNLKNTNDLYYVTNTIFYRSTDGGVSWETKKLPTARAGWKLVIDPEQPTIMYMGLKKYKK